MTQFIEAAQSLAVEMWVTQAVTEPTIPELRAMTRAEVRAVAAELGVLTPTGKPSSIAERVIDFLTERRHKAALANAMRLHPERYQRFARMEQQWDDGRHWFDARDVTGPKGCGLLMGFKAQSVEELRAALLGLGWDENNIIDDTARLSNEEVKAQFHEDFQRRLHLGAHLIGVRCHEHMPMHEVKAALSAADWYGGAR